MVLALPRSVRDIRFVVPAQARGPAERVGIGDVQLRRESKEQREDQIYGGGLNDDCSKRCVLCAVIPGHDFVDVIAVQHQPNDDQDGDEDVQREGHRKIRSCIVDTRGVPWRGRNCAHLFEPKNSQHWGRVNSFVRTQSMQRVPSELKDMSTGRAITAIPETVEA